MRHYLVLLHRWFGLFTAVFLAVAGLTGAVIAWDHELDAWLNPSLYYTDGAGPDRAGTASDPLELADAFEAAHPDLIVSFLPLATEAGHTLTLSVEPLPGSAAPEPGFNQVALDPASGAIVGQRYWGAVSLSREHLLPFLYKLHYSLHIPDAGALETGVLLMGIVGIVWVIDCIVALIISFPSPRSWRKSLALRWRQGGHKLLFDVHRSGGVWVWLLLLIVAVTSVSMNLGAQVVRPVVNALSPLTASPFDASPPAVSVPPAQSRREVLAVALRDARARGITAPAGGMFYSPMYNIYGVGFFDTGGAHGDGGLGNPWLYYAAADGRALGADIPGTGSAGDIFMQAQFPLHSGRIAGVPGRVLVSLLGVLVAAFSVTGVVIWARKRAAQGRRPKRIR